MTAWLGVVSAEHVARGVALGIAQVHHGRRAGLDRMSPGDGMVYYSPRERMRDGEPLRAFTAVGIVADREPWQADEGTWRPWRRAVHWDDAQPVRVEDLRGRLALTASPTWGYALRRGLIPLTGEDFAVIRAAMTGLRSVRG